MKLILSIFGILSFFTLNAQTYRAKAGALIVPLSQGGFGMINIGTEAFNKKMNKSFQLTFNFAGGLIAADAESTKRTWVTLERIFYFGNPETKHRFFFTVFSEFGVRKKLPGYSDFPIDSILNKKKSFEINPGSGIGINFKIKKRWGIDLSGGPKLIVASHKDKYYNSISKQYFTVNYNNVKAGLRFLANFSYQF